MLTYGSLFTGIGGIDLGLDRAGWECQWQVESDPHASAILARHWPDVRRYGDIKTIDPAQLERVDLVCGGFPCQPTSVAGRRRGAEDDRWLWPEFARVLGGVRPRFALLENPTGLLSFREFGDVLGDLASLGFDAEWDVVSAAALGALHERERVFVVAYASGSRGPLGVSEPRQRQKGDAEIPIDRGKGAYVADAEGFGGELRSTQDQRSRRPSSGRLAHANGQSPIGPSVAWDERDPWATEPDVGRVVNGLPGRVDRLTRLGNAVVPQVAEAVGRAIAEVA